MKRAGWDALRHYELAANGCVPCFRELERKPPLCPPYGLDESACVPYADYDDLVAKLAAIGPDDYARLREGALRWASQNSTRERARQLLDACGVGYLRSETRTSDAGNSRDRKVAS